MVKNLFLFAAIVYTIALITVSFVSLNGVPKLGSSFDDKIYHVIAYLILSFLWVTYFKNSPQKHVIILVFLGTLSFGIIIETVQHQINYNRMYEVYDLLSNCLGVVFGTLAALKLKVFKLK